MFGFFGVFLVLSHHGEGGRAGPILGLHNLVSPELDAVGQGFDVLLGELCSFHLLVSIGALKKKSRPPHTIMYVLVEMTTIAKIGCRLANNFGLSSQQSSRAVEQQNRHVWSTALILPAWTLARLRPKKRTCI